MVCDPFTDCYAARNLDLEFWDACQKDQDIIETAEGVKEVINNGLMADISLGDLNYLGLCIAVRAELKSYLAKYLDHAWWTGVALCLMTNCKMEEFKNYKKIVFTKSSGSVPLVGDNVIHKVSEFNRIELTPRIPLPRKEDEFRLT